MCKSIEHAIKIQAKQHDVDIARHNNKNAYDILDSMHRKSGVGSQTYKII
jgi:hypothetical protein